MPKSKSWLSAAPANPGKRPTGKKELRNQRAKLPAQIGVC